MPDQSNGGPPSALPDLGSEECWAQRIILAELVVTPPRAGDSIGSLLEYLPVPADTIEPAIASGSGRRSLRRTPSTCGP
jgi:hypothetical protein